MQELLVMVRDFSAALNPSLVHEDDPLPALLKKHGVPPLEVKLVKSGVRATPKHSSRQPLSQQTGAEASSCVIADSSRAPSRAQPTQHTSQSFPTGMSSGITIIADTTHALFEESQFAEEDAV